MIVCLRGVFSEAPNTGPGLVAEILLTFCPTTSCIFLNLKEEPCVQHSTGIFTNRKN